MKNILPKLFYIHELQKNDDINVQQICSTDNVIDLFTKSSPIANFKKMLHKIEMQGSRIFSLEGVNRVVLFFPYEVLSHWVFLVRFLMRQPICVLLEMCTLFPSLDFFFYWVFSSKVLTRYIIYQLDIQGGVINIFTL